MRTAGRTPAERTPRFALLGPLEVRDDLGRSVPVSAPKQRGVLAALLVDAGTVVSADRLADLLWDGSPPPSARKTLENYVSRLRRLLGPVSGGRIITRSPGYAVEPRDPSEVDLLVQSDLAGRAQQAAAGADWERTARHARDALALWRGDPFCDVPVERLRREQAPHLSEARLRLRELALTAQVMMGDHHGALPDLRRLVEETLIREQPWEMLILALFRCGRKAEALEEYHRVGRVLRDELGVSPGRGLQQLHRLMLADDRPASAGPEGGGRRSVTVTGAARQLVAFTDGGPPTFHSPHSPPAGPPPPARSDAGRPTEARFGPPAVIHETLALRYQGLPAPRTAADPDPARALRLLSEWNGADLPLPAISALLHRPAELVRRDLDTLAARKLAEEAGPERYRLPATVRLFGRTLSRSGPDDDPPGAALRRLVGWYLRTAAEAGNLIHPYGRRPALHTVSDENPPEAFNNYREASVWFANEHANLISAVRAAASAGEHALAWRLAATLTGYFHMSKRWTDWIMVAQIGLASARHLHDGFGESALLLSAGRAYDDLRMYSRSLESLDQAVAVAVGKAAADQWGEAVGLLCLAHVHGPHQTMVHHRRAQKIFRSVGNSWGFALAQIELGRAHRWSGDLEQAIACHRSGAAILADLGDNWALSLAHLGLAEDLLAGGDHALAAAACRQTLALSHEVHDRHTTARALTFLGQSYLRVPDLSAARGAWTEALKIFEELADPRATSLRVQIATLDATAAISS
ncbi:DNA-binding transcriptional activator of the SARP family [Frankia sp. EI5c]|uniref:BTAD domain-containing putative transcriptional regulator n=1 Tax=Frankia sp. EI5c TaxID=683316 RepID=UPI0007C36752|nr:BTAD domain-containing putative transcriptional regulator [Frankia sp. EI5c]OAA18718.1 DNA-binding transcriptional activator of the SARP family [Frankia sp. EI5c]